MSWKKLKSKFSEQDMDAEFEKFLNESLSDESTTNSPRRSITPKGARSKQKLLSSTQSKFDKPWWATSDDDEKSGFSDAAKQMWVKNKGKDQLDHNNEGTKHSTEVLSRDSLEVTASRPGTALDTIMSEPEEYSASFEKSEKSLKQSSRSSSLDETTDATPNVNKSPLDAGKTMSSSNVDLMATLPPGMETLDEMKDKEAFFDNLERDANNSIDYGALNKKFDKEHGLTNKVEEYAEVDLQLYKPDYSSDDDENDNEYSHDSVSKKSDNSISKKSDDSLAENSDEQYSRKSVESHVREKNADSDSTKSKQSLSKSSNSSISRQNSKSSVNGSPKSHTERKSVTSRNPSDSENESSKSKNDSSLSKPSSNVVAESSRHDNFAATATAISPLKDQNIGKVKSASMPAKIPLLETLESTYGNNLAERLNKFKKYEKKGLLTEGSSSTAPYIGDSSSHLNLGASSYGANTMQITDDRIFLDTGKTTADLTKVLQDVKGLSSRSLDQFSPPNVEIVQDIAPTQPVGSNMLVLDKEQEKELKVNQHDLRPAVSTVNEQIENSLLKSVYKTELNFTEDTPHQRYKIIQDEINDAIKEELEKVIKDKKEEEHGFSLKPIEQSLNEIEHSHGFDLQPIQTILDDSRGSIFDKEETEQTPSSRRFLRNKDVQQHSTKFLKTSSVKPTGHALVKKTPSYLRATINSAKKSKIPIYKQDDDDVNMSTHSKVTSAQNKKTTPSKFKSPKPQSESRKILSKKQRTVSRNNDNTTGDTQQQLLESMQHMTSYLKQIADQSSPVSKSITINRDIHIDTLTREQSLQEELQELRILYETECDDHNKLKVNMRKQEKLWKDKYKELNDNKDVIIKELNDEIDVLNKKLQLSDKEIKNEKVNAIKTNVTLKDNDDDGVEKLNEQLVQQETLLNGYQQENERLYNQIKKYETEKKRYESQILKENKKLASENANLKEHLDTVGSRDVQPGSAEFAAKQITQLKNQIKFYQSREQEYKEDILNLEREVSSLKRSVSVYEKQKNANNNKGDYQKEIDRLKTSHAVEVDKLTKRLKWYGENQQLLDKDTTDLASQRNEIKKLRELIERLEDENNKLRKNERDKKHERNSSDKKILDLQRQVKEMEDIIRRRHPNSLPALIFAASSVPNEVRSYEATSSSETTNEKSHHLYLQKKIKQLENELENKDIDQSKKIRAIEQNFTSVSLRYEDHIKQLENKVSELTLKLKSSKSIINIENELEESEKKYQELISDLKKELEIKNADINNLKLQLIEQQEIENEVYVSKTKKLDAKSYISLNNDIAKLREKLRTKDSELKQSRLTISLLQKEREDMLTQKTSTKAPTRRKEVWKELDSYETYKQELNEKQSELTEMLNSKLQLENTVRHLEGEKQMLKQLVEQLRIENEERRLKVEGAHASMLNEKRKLNESYEEQLKELKESYERTLEKQRIDYVLQHSNSKVAELNGKIKSYELIIEHMKGTIEEGKMEKKKLGKSKENEEILNTKIKRLEAELHEARSLQTPEVFHYRALQSKILALESRHSEKEEELKKVINKIKYKSSLDMDELEEKWKEILRSKDDEVQQFRTELDSMLEVLQELQRQGVMLPTKDDFIY